MEEEVLTSVEVHSRSFSRSELSALLPLDESLEKLLEISRQPEGRESLARSMATIRLASILPELSSHCPELFSLHRRSDELLLTLPDSDPPASPTDNWLQAPPAGTDVAAGISGSSGISGTSANSGLSSSALRPLTQLLRVLRNLCAGQEGEQHRDAFLQSGSVDAVATIVDRLIAANVHHQQDQQLHGISISPNSLPPTLPSQRSPNLPSESASDSISSLSSIMRELQELKGGAASVPDAENKLTEATPVSTVRLPTSLSTPSSSSSASNESPLIVPATTTTTTTTTTSTTKVPASAAKSQIPSSTSSPSFPERSPALPGRKASGMPTSGPRKSRSINRANSPNLSIPISTPQVSPALFAPPSSASPFPVTPSSLQSRAPPSPIPLSPSPMSSSLPLSLPPDHSDTIKASLQLLGNFCNGGVANQSVTWDRCFPGIFSRLVCIQSAEVQEPCSMILFTCCKGSEERMEELASSSEGVGIIAGLLRATAAGLKEGHGMAEDALLNTWISLLLQLLCLQKSFLAPIFRGLMKHSLLPALGQINGPFCPEQATLLWALWKVLVDLSHSGKTPDTAAPEKSGSVGEMTDSTALLKKKFVWTDVANFVFRESKRAATFIAKMRPETKIPAEKALPELSLFPSPTSPPFIFILGFSLQILRIVCAGDPSGGEEGGNSDGPIKVLLAEGFIETLVGMLDALGPPKQARTQKNSREGSEGNNAMGSSVFPSSLPYVGYRRDIVAILGNACHRQKCVQDEIRQKGGLYTVLQQCVVDDQNPLLREWGLWAVRNLLEGNEENQKEIGGLEIQGGGSSPEIEAMGLRVVVTPATGRPRLENIGAGETKESAENE